MAGRAAGLKVMTQQHGVAITALLFATDPARSILGDLCKLQWSRGDNSFSRRTRAMRDEETGTNEQVIGTIGTELSPLSGGAEGEGRPGSVPQPTYTSEQTDRRDQNIKTNGIQGSPCAQHTIISQRTCAKDVQSCTPGFPSRGLRWHV